MLIKRTDTSSYFPADLFKREKECIESIASAQYFSPDEDIPSSGDIILITNTHTRLENWMRFQERVKLIIHPNSGFENLNTQNWKVPVVLGNTIRAQAVAEWCLGVLYQEIGFVRHHRRWPLSRQNPRPLMSELKTLILGQGPIGKILKSHLSEAQVFDPWLGMDLNLNQKWDVVILAASANPKNIDLINSAFLSHCSDTLLLINPARGELVNKTDLESFLLTHPKARAYLDVHTQEPYPSDFYSSSQIIATPHIAGVWDGLIESMLRFEVQALEHFNKQTIPHEWLLHNRLTPQGFYR